MCVLMCKCALCVYVCVCICVSACVPFTDCACAVGPGIPSPQELDPQLLAMLRNLTLSTRTLAKKANVSAIAAGEKKQTQLSYMSIN